MTQTEFITNLFCRINDLTTQAEHKQAKLSKSELVTIGLLFALKGTSQRAFYRWLSQNFLSLFPNLPERTRLFRRLTTHRKLTDQFLAQVTVLGVADSYGIELIHPIRENRQKKRKRFARKGFSNWRWIVGGKLCVVANQFEFVTAWRAGTANVSDITFHPLIRQFHERMIVSMDKRFRAEADNPVNEGVQSR